MDWLVSLWSTHPDVVLGSVILLLVLDKTGAIQRFFRARHESRVNERTLLSQDQQQLVQDLQMELDAIRRRSATDIEFYLREIAQLRVILEERGQTIVTLVRGESRSRHAFVNMISAYAALRDFCWRNNLRPQPFDGWSDLMGLDPDLDERVKTIFSAQPPGQLDA